MATSIEYLVFGRHDRVHSGLRVDLLLVQR